MSPAARNILIGVGFAVASLTPGAPARAGELVDLIDTLDPPTALGAPPSVVYGKIAFPECFTDWMSLDPTELGPIEVLSRTEEYDLATGFLSAMMVFLLTDGGRRVVLHVECGSGAAIVSARTD